MPSIIIRSGSRNPDRPGSLANQVNGSTADTRQLPTSCGTGISRCSPTRSTGPSASAAQASQHNASSRVLTRRHCAAVPATASTLSSRPNVGTPSLSGPWKMNPRWPSPKSAIRGEGANMSGSDAE